ncbi:hypothetical protein LWI29_016704 [Acer saccharum]|uniref:Uncharacterized protein n=1 Tax=Acer saccharum TaxID=4024 RepID=A0AA39VQF0_ACESA|nr:hypothetical protein LWI29_016704 [Acer saccharum]
MTNFGGKLVVVWEENGVSGKEMGIRCAEIVVERGGDGELWGKIGCEVVLKNALEIALCAGEPALDDKRKTSARPAHKHKFAQALDDQRSDRRTTSGKPLGDLRWWACAGVDQRTTSDRPLGDLRWWTSARPATDHWAICAGELRWSGA